MILKGDFYFDKRRHPGECEIDEKNNIYLTINESSINSFKGKITGIANNRRLSIYDCMLIDHNIGYYKYRANYLTEEGMIKLENIDLSKNIFNFRFTFEPLNEWLGFDTLLEKEDTININIPETIVLYDNNGLKIEIKYFRDGDIIFNNTINNLRVIPYICVESSKIIKVNIIMDYIQMITRFFALLMGFSCNVNCIMFKSRYKEYKPIKYIENTLIINADLSNCYDISAGYSYNNLRTYYNQLTEKIDIMFNRWFENYKKYKEAILFYYSAYNTHAIESDFLNMCKCLEKISYLKDNRNEQARKNKRLHELIIKFYAEHKKELIDSLKKSEFKKKYVNKIDEIHEEIANSIVHQYRTRIDLSKRINDLDVNDELISIFRENDVTSLHKSSTVYDYIAYTRNYYTHLDKDKPIIKNIYFPKYNRILEKLFIKELLKIIIVDMDYINNVIKNDNYLTIYDNRE